MHKKKIRILFVSYLITALFFSYTTAIAMEVEKETAGIGMLPTVNEEIISVDLPTIGEESPFDFFIDPQRLIYETNAAKYGGGTVEEGASLLFHNYKNKDFDFSSYSDSLKVINRSTVPVVVRVTAKITDLGDIKLEQDDAFEGEESNAIYLAVVDDEGNERPLSEEGEVVLEVEMKEAPAEAYTYYYNEEQDVYEYVSTDKEDIDYDTYSFGLRGECNIDADWSELSASPKVIVTWEVEPVISERNNNSERSSEENVKEILVENEGNKAILDEDQGEFSEGETLFDDDNGETEDNDGVNDLELRTGEISENLADDEYILSVSANQTDDDQNEMQ